MKMTQAIEMEDDELICLVGEIELADRREQIRFIVEKVDILAMGKSLDEAKVDIWQRLEKILLWKVESPKSEVITNRHLTLRTVMK